MTRDARRQLREVRARLNAVLDAAVDAIVMIDERGRIELFSAAAERLFGRSRKDVLGQNVSLLMPEPFQGEHDSYLQHYLRTGFPKIIGIGREARAVHRDGTEFPVDLSVGEIASFGEGRRFVGIIRDIRERVRVEEEARQHRERLAHVTRLSTLGEMAGGIAHEINQPLTAIATYAQGCSRMLEADAPNLLRVKEGSDKIAEQALRAGEVIRRLRAFARRRGGERESVDPNALVRDGLELCEADARSRKIPVEYEPAEDLPPIHVDTIQIQQVVVNLVRNALESMEGAGGEVRVLVRTAARDGMVEISVADQGGGVTPEARGELFHPFFTTKKRGIGLGLSICRSIVIAHSGNLDFQPNPESGSTFRFTIPAEATGE